MAWMEKVQPELLEMLDEVYEKYFQEVMSVGDFFCLVEDGIFKEKATAGGTHCGGEHSDGRVVDSCMLDFKCSGISGETTTHLGGEDPVETHLPPSSGIKFADVHNGLELISKVPSVEHFRIDAADSECDGEECCPVVPAQTGHRMGSGKGSGERSVLIYGTGGGPFDVSHLTTEIHVSEVEAAAGDEHLGGDDFVKCSVDVCIQDFKRSQDKDLAEARVECIRIDAALGSDDEEYCPVVPAQSGYRMGSGKGSGERSVLIFGMGGGSFEGVRVECIRIDPAEPNVRIDDMGCGAFDVPLPCIEDGIFEVKAHGLDINVMKSSGEHSARINDMSGGAFGVPLPSNEDGIFKVKAYGLDKNDKKVNGERNARINDMSCGTFDAPLPSIEDGIFEVIEHGLDKKVSRERKMRISDMVGGTFDAPPPTIENGIFEVKANGLDKKSSGGLSEDSFGNRVAALCIQDFKRKSRGKDPSAIAGFTADGNKKDFQCQHANCQPQGFGQWQHFQCCGMCRAA